MKVPHILVFLAAISFTMARETTRAIDRMNDNSGSDEDSFNEVRSSGFLEDRKKKPFHDLFLLMGGLQSLVTFVVIKIKIVLVAVTIIGIIALALKVFGVLKYAGYFYKHDYPPIGPPPQEFSGYSGPYPPIFYPHEHETYGDSPSHSDHYGRSSNDQDPTGASYFPKSVNMTEMMYSIMNVDKDDCRASLMCEFDIMLSRSPFFNYLTRQPVTRPKKSGSKDDREECRSHYEKCLGSTSKRFIRRKRRRVGRGY